MPDFFYDEQIRRYILQFMRIFADFKIELPADENGIKAQKRVPIVYGDMSRQVAQILNQNSANATLAAPAMSAYIQAMEINDERRRDTTNVLPAQVIERTYDESTGTYSSEAGNRYTVERYMPVPYKLTMNLDLWTTNTTDKLQLIEQILVIFNPGVQLQTNNNPLDYSSIFEVKLNGMSWSSRGVPQGADSNNDIMTMMFDVEIWINPPAKVKKQTIVEQIVTTLFDASITEDETRDIFDPLQTAFADLEQFIITPGNLKLEVLPGGTVRLVGEYGNTEDEWTWETLTRAYGKIDPETTTLRLKTQDDIDLTTGDVLGTLEVVDDTTATFVVDSDTLPTTITSGAVTAIIDPRRTYPGDGSLPAAAVGQRYLLISDDDTVGDERIIADNDGGNPWGSITTYENDIIEYNGVNWFVSFDASEVTPPLYVVNTEDGQHYRFDGTEWNYTYLGIFNPGYWRIEI
jgi:hypothetical protein